MDIRVKPLDHMSRKILKYKDRDSYSIFVSTDFKYVYKTLLSSKSDKREFYYNEEKALRCIDSIYVIKLINVSFEDDQMTIITPYIGDKSLIDYRLNFFSLERKDQWCFLHKIVLGIRDIHNSGFVHRDIKPDNIIVKHVTDNQYIPIIIDLGYANHKNYISDSVIGTPYYILPNILCGEIDISWCNLVKGDIFSLVATIHYLYTKNYLYPTAYSINELIKYQKLYSPLIDTGDRELDVILKNTIDKLTIDILIDGLS